MEERLKLGELLVRAGLVAKDELDGVLEQQAAEGSRLGALLVARGLLSETQVVQILSQQLSVPWVSLQHVNFSRELLARVPVDLASRYTLIPIFVRRVSRAGETLYVAMDDPVNDAALREVSVAAGLPVRPMIAAPSDIRRAIESNYGVPQDESRVSTELPETAPCSSMVPSFLLESAPPSSLTHELQDALEPANKPPPLLALTLADGSHTLLALGAHPGEPHLMMLNARMSGAEAGALNEGEAVDWRSVSTSLLAWLEDRKLISGWELRSGASRG
jgi:type IV pilus assembly protein PilB